MWRDACARARACAYLRMCHVCAAGVETHCFYSHGMPTPVGAVYVSALSIGPHSWLDMWVGRSVLTDARYKTDDMSDESPPSAPSRWRWHRTRCKPVKKAIRRLYIRITNGMPSAW